MKRYILFILITGLVLNACNNPYEKELQEVNSLIALVDETEKSLLSIDTSSVFAAKAQMEKDLSEFNMLVDTMNKEEAFKVGDIFGNKKKLYRLTENYPNFVRQIEFTKTQLENLKQDLENGLIKKEEFSGYYEIEQSALMNLNHEIDKSINGIETAIGKFEIDRPDLLKMIEQKKLDKTVDE